MPNKVTIEVKDRNNCCRVLGTISRAIYHLSSGAMRVRYNNIRYSVGGGIRTPYCIYMTQEKWDGK